MFHRLPVSLHMATGGHSRSMLVAKLLGENEGAGPVLDSHSPHSSPPHTFWTRGQSPGYQWLLHLVYESHSRRVSPGARSRRAPLPASVVLVECVIVATEAERRGTLGLPPTHAPPPATFTQRHGPPGRCTAHQLAHLGTALLGSCFQPRRVHRAFREIVTCVHPRPESLEHAQPQ